MTILLLWLLAKATPGYTPPIYVPIKPMPIAAERRHEPRGPKR